VSPEYVAVTVYAATAREPAVEHDAEPDATVAVHSVVPPAVKMTVPVAADGSAVAMRVTELPWVVLVGLAEAVKDDGASVTVKLVVTVDPVKFVSPP
jgi:hypothetical protein